MTRPLNSGGSGSDQRDGVERRAWHHGSAGGAGAAAAQATTKARASKPE